MTYDSADWKSIEQKLQKTLDEERYRHTLGVSYTAAAIAMAHGYDLQKAKLAGLLHDCAKHIPAEERLRLCEENAIEITEIERKNTSLLHSKLGVYIAERDYGIQDEEILGAIRWHTTGKPEMSELEQIIYIADYIEPNRDKWLLIDPEIRKSAYTNLNQCCMLIMEKIVKYIRSKQKDMDEMTIEAYQYYKELTR